MLVTDADSHTLYRYPLYTSDLSWSMYSGSYQKADWWCRYKFYNTTFMPSIPIVLEV